MEDDIPGAYEPRCIGWEVPYSVRNDSRRKEIPNLIKLKKLYTFTSHLIIVSPLFTNLFFPNLPHKSIA